MYTIGLVGCGVIGSRFADTIASRSDLDLAAVCDVNAARATSFADEYETAAYTDHETLFTEAALDLVHVGVPPVHHRAVVTAALEHDTHVICEKPLAPDADEGARMVEQAAASDRLTAVNLPFRYTPGFREMVSRVTDGSIGTPRRVMLDFRFPRWPREWQDVDWLKGREQGGPLREVGTHFLFGVQELFGPIEQVTATVRYSGPGRYEESIVGTFTVDGIDGRIDLLTDHNQPEENVITVVGTDGALSLTDWYRLIADRGTDDETVVTADRASTVELLLDAVVATLDGSGGDLVGFEEANRVQRVVDAVFDSDGTPATGLDSA